VTLEGTAIQASPPGLPTVEDAVTVM
jgi:hypothetical protein